MDQALFQRMQEAARRFRSGESDREEIMTPNGLAVLQRDASDPRGFRIDFVGDGARHSVSLQEYPALAARAPGYPAPLPFLEGCRATVNTLDQTVTWHDLARPREAFESVCRQMTDDGWVPEEHGGAEGSSFQKEAAVRELALVADDGPPRLVLRERRSPPRG